MPNYKLVNPYIEGEFDTTCQGKTSSEAAQSIWKSLSEHITNNVPKFYFTLEKTSDNSLHHFVIKESIENDMVNYKLKEHSVNLKKKDINEFKKSLSKFQKNMSGGAKKKKKKRRYKDDDDYELEDDDSDSEMFDKIRMQQYMMLGNPIVYYWYNPYLYQVESFFVPTFTVPITPYVEIQLSSAWM